MRNKNCLLTIILLICFIATGIYVPVASAAKYDMFNGPYNPKYEGAKSLNPTNSVPSVPPNSVVYLFDTANPDIKTLVEGYKKMFEGRLDTMQAIIVDGEWKGVQYWVESVKSVSNPSTYYRTQYLTFQVGPYKAIDSYERYRTTAPASLPANGKWYDIAYITDDYIKGIFKAYHPEHYDEVLQYFQSEEFLYVGAVIEILGSGGVHKDWIDTYGECATLPLTNNPFLLRPDYNGT